MSQPRNLTIFLELLFMPFQWDRALAQNQSRLFAVHNVGIHFSSSFPSFSLL